MQLIVNYNQMVAGRFGACAPDRDVVVMEMSVVAGTAAK